MTLNIILTVGDVIVCTLAILAFSWAAWFFSKWWITLFTLIVLGFYNNHGIVIETDMSQVRSAEPTSGGEVDG